VVRGLSTVDHSINKSFFNFFTYQSNFFNFFIKVIGFIPKLF